MENGTPVTSITLSGNSVAVLVAAFVRVQAERGPAAYDHVDLGEGTHVEVTPTLRGAVHVTLFNTDPRETMQSARYTSRALAEISVARTFVLSRQSNPEAIKADRLFPEGF